METDEDALMESASVSLQSLGCGVPSAAAPLQAPPIGGIHPNSPRCDESTTSAGKAQDDRVTVIIVTSPAPSHPSLFLLDKVIESLVLIRGSERCRVVILFDGYVVQEVPRPKSGRVTAAMAAAYEENYRLALAKYARIDECNYCRFHLVKSDVHRGFAMCVRWGLEHYCASPYALIVQHDRAFTRPFDHLDALMDAMDSKIHIRYVGFPTVMSAGHEAVIRRRYHLDALLRDDMLISLPDTGFSLMPLIFWYDSNHLGHVQRYLEIFKPFTHVSETIRTHFSSKAIKQMLLRQGDFIEDRFGQAQRNMLVALGGRDGGECDDDSSCGDVLRSTFLWFGSYLISSGLMREAPGYDQVSDRTGWPSALEAPDPQSVYVSHLRGRTYLPDWTRARTEAGTEEANGEEGSRDDDNDDSDCGSPAFWDEAP